MRAQDRRFKNSAAACGIVGLLAAFGFNSGSAVASPQLVSLIFNSVAGSPHHVGADAFRAAVLAQLPGRVTIDERGGAPVGSETVILSATQSGAVNLAVVSGAVVSSVVPELAVFDIPFLFRDTAHAKAVAEGPVGAAIAAKFLDKGLVLLAVGKQGFRNVTNSKRPIRTPADLAGLKIRVIPNEIYQMTFKTLGAEVIPMDFPLVYSALKDGRIQGQENPIANIAGSRLYEVQKYFSMTQHFFAPLTFVANREFFESLDRADQSALLAAAKAAAETTWQVGDVADAKGIEEMTKGGMEIIKTIDRQPFVDAMKPLEPEFEKRFGKDVLAAIRSTR